MDGLTKFLHHPRVCQLFELSKPPILPATHWRKLSHDRLLTTPSPVIVVAIANGPGSNLLTARLPELSDFIRSLNLSSSITAQKISDMEASLIAWVPLLHSDLAPTFKASKEFLRAAPTPSFISKRLPITPANTIQHFLTQLPALTIATHGQSSPLQNSAHHLH